MARGLHYTKLSLSSALILSFSGVCFKKSQNAPRPSEHPPVVWHVLFICVEMQSSDIFLSSKQTMWRISKQHVVY